MGLLQLQKPVGNAAPEAAAEGAPPPGPEGYVDDAEGNVSPEEQAEYEQFVNNAYSFMYEGGKVKPEIIQALDVKATDDPNAPNAPQMALANAAVQVVSKLDASARQAGQPVSDDVLYHGAVAVIEDLAEIARNANIKDFSEEEMGGALMNAIDMYRPKLIADGRTSEETLKAQFAELDQADKAGKLGDVLPGFGGQTVGQPPIMPQQ